MSPRRQFIYQGTEKLDFPLKESDVNYLISYGSLQNLFLITIYWFLVPIGIAIFFFFNRNFYLDYGAYINIGFLVVSALIDLILYYSTRDYFTIVLIPVFRISLRRKAIRNLIYAFALYLFRFNSGLLRIFILIGIVCTEAYFLYDAFHPLPDKEAASKPIAFIYLLFFIGITVFCFSEYYNQYYNLVIDFCFFLHGLYLLIRFIDIFRRYRVILEEEKGFTDYTIE